MRFLLLPYTLLATASAIAAQSPTTNVTPVTPMGVFGRIGTSTPIYRTVPGTPSATPNAPLIVVAEVHDNNVIVGHARTKVSLRSLESLPTVRIHEAGYVPAISPLSTREVGTSAMPGTAGGKYQIHSWLIRFQGAPNWRLRLHTKLRSIRVGHDPLAKKPVEITGIARVDVGNDGSIEFTKPLDGERYLDNQTVVTDSNGTLLVRVETAALIKSASNTTASYRLTMDVSLEPVLGVVSSFSPYGPLCGPSVFGITWINGNLRHTRVILDGGTPNAAALLVVGGGRIQVPLPGVTCQLLALPLAIVGYKTSNTGRIVSDLPTFPWLLPVDVQFQFGTFQSTGTLVMSKALHYRVFLGSDNAYRHYDINQVLGTGQSLSIGGLGTPILSTTQAYKNLMFENGVRGQSTKLTPLIEKNWETMSSGLANLAAELYQRPFNNKSAPSPNNTHDVLMSIHGEGGLPYLLLRKGTQPFENGINQFKLAQFVAANSNRSHVVRCVTCVHGETDHTTYNTGYANDLIRWQRDYETEIQSRGQTEPVPMLHTQMSSFTRYNTSVSVIHGQQLLASSLRPRSIVLVGPKYQFDYVDGVHLTSRSYRHMGEYYGKVYNRLFVEGGTWTPLRPLTATRTGAVIQVRFHVPEPPLILDQNLVANPGSFGFEYWDNSGSTPAIQSVRLIDEDTVEIKLAAQPNGTQEAVRYAYTGIAGAHAGPKTGARGNLRDSDATPSRHGYPLFNWCVHFSLAVN